MDYKYNYKIATDIDLVSNCLLNVSQIVGNNYDSNTYSNDLLIKTSDSINGGNLFIRTGHGDTKNNNYIHLYANSATQPILDELITDGIQVKSDTNIDIVSSAESVDIKSLRNITLITDNTESYIKIEEDVGETPSCIMMRSTNGDVDFLGDVTLDITKTTIANLVGNVEVHRGGTLLDTTTTSVKRVIGTGEYGIHYPIYAEKGDGAFSNIILSSGSHVGMYTTGNLTVLSEGVVELRSFDAFLHSIHINNDTSFYSFALDSSSLSILENLPTDINITNNLTYNQTGNISSTVTGSVDSTITKTKVEKVTEDVTETYSANYINTTTGFINISTERQSSVFTDNKVFSLEQKEIVNTEGATVNTAKLTIENIKVNDVSNFRDYCVYWDSELNSLVFGLGNL